MSAPTPRSYTDAELEAGVNAAWNHILAVNPGLAEVRQAIAAAFRAVLPDHDARVRAATVEEIARGFAAGCRCPTPDPPCTAELLAAHIRGTYADPPTSEGDHHGMA